MFSYFVYILICLFSLEISSFYVLKHVRLLISLVFVFALFYVLSFWVRVFGACLHMHNFVCARRLEVCVQIQLARVCRLMYVHAFFNLETLIRVFLLLFLCFFYILCLCFVLFLCSWVVVSLFICLFVLNMIRLGFSLMFSLFYHEHAHDMFIHWCIGVMMQYSK